MKKNLMSVLILALLVVNIALTAIMMFSTTGAMKSTTALVGDIAAVLALELDLGGEVSDRPSMEDTVVYDICTDNGIESKYELLYKCRIEQKALRGLNQ